MAREITWHCTALENHERVIDDIKHLFVFGLTKTSSRMINIYFLVILELIIFKLQSSVIKMLPFLFLTSCCWTSCSSINNLKLLKMTGVNINEDSLNIGQWVGMEWEDMNLSMCNCRDNEYQDIYCEALISVCPTCHFVPGRKLRVTILTPNKQFLMQKRNLLEHSP